jgi:hypothetical protein
MLDLAPLGALSPCADVSNNDFCFRVGTAHSLTLPLRHALADLNESVLQRCVHLRRCLLYVAQYAERISAAASSSLVDNQWVSHNNALNTVCEQDRHAPIVGRLFRCVVLLACSTGELMPVFEQLQLHVLYQL